jgi:hypothetical protein
MSQMPPPLPPHSSNTPEPFGATDTFPELMPPRVAGPLGGGMQAHRGSTILGLGIASLGVHVLGLPGVIIPCCCCGGTLASIGLAVPALVMANTDLAAMAAGRMDPAGMSSTKSGKTCAIIALVLAGLSLAGGVVAAIVQQTILGTAGSGSPFGP